MRRSAVFDRTRRYRYLLRRRWAAGPTAVFVLLNPSTADDRRDDATIRRCIGFARRWGCGSLEVVNLFARRATRPADLMRAHDPVGPDNDRYLRAAARRSDHLIVGWGGHGTYLGRARAVEILMDGVRPVHCLGLTRTGEPRHPLRLPYATALRPYMGSSDAQRSGTARAASA